MRFDELTYLHTDIVDDSKEIKFQANFENDKESKLTVEIWIQDEHKTVLIVDNYSNETYSVNEKEYRFVLRYAINNNLI